MLKDLHTLVLNLPHRKDRLESVSKEYLKLGFEKDFELFVADSEENSPYISATQESKVDIINKYTKGAKKQKANMFRVFGYLVECDVPQVLILEDDVILDEDIYQKLDDFIKEVPNDWDILQISSSHFKRPLKISENVYKVTGSVLNTATIYRKSSYKKCIELCAEERPFDLSLGMVNFLNHGLNIYSPRYIMARESLSPSDVSERDYIPINSDILKQERFIPVEILNTY